MAKIVLTISADNKATQSVALLNKEVQTLSKTLSSIKVNKDLTAQIKALTANYKQMGIVARETLKIESQNITNENKKQKAIRLTSSQIKTLEKRYADLLRTIKGLEKSYPEGTFDGIKESAEKSLKSVQSLDATSETFAQDLQALSANYQDLSTKMSLVRLETDKLQPAIEKERQSILSMARGIFEWQIATTLVMKPLRTLLDLLGSIDDTLVKTEDTVIAFQRVVGKNISGDTISSALYKLAQDYGQTFDNVQSIALDFARTGLSWNDTIKATEAALLGLNTADLYSKDAATGLIAVLQQYKLEASDLESVIDKLNITQDNAAVTTDKLLAALQRMGSSAKNANLSLEESVALATALSSATGRSGENIGTALNSLIQYSSKDSALNVFAGLSENVADVVGRYRKGAATILEVWRAVSSEIQHLTEKQADLLDSYFETEDGSAFKDAMADDLEDMYDELAGVYTTANTFRKNYFIALLGNMDEVDKALVNMQQSAGYSQKQNEDYLESYTAKANSLQAKWQDIANDEQGLLGIKKDLLDIGSGVLDIIKYAGGLKTVLIALGVVIGTIVMQVKGAQIVAGLQLVGKTIKSLTVDAIPNLIATWRAFRGETTLLNGQVVKLGQSTATFGQVAKAALPIVTAIIIAISALDKAIRDYYEENEEKERKAIEQQNDAIAKSNESIEAQKKEVAQMNEVVTSVENLRKILDDSSQSEEEKAKAQDKLLQIQNTLIDSNNSYKDSLDLTNGSLKEQLGLIEQLTTEQLKQKANDFLTQNKSEIEIAKNRLESNSTTNTDMLFSGEGWDRGGFRDIINTAISGAGVGDVASINEDNTYGVFHNYGKNVSEGFKNGFWDGVGELLGFGTVFDKASYIGESNAGFSFSGTVEQQIEAIEKLKTYIATNKDSLGLSAEQVVSITTELGNRYNQLNSEEYKQAQLLAEKAKATQDWLNGTIDEAEYIKIVYGIEKDISKELGEQTNDITKVTGAYDDLIPKLKELRDLQKESTEWEEKKLAVMEAEQALENARNEATVRRFNQATGQWEWQTDEKKIAEAEKNLEQAQLNLQGAAYSNIIEQLENETATNESILAILQEVAPLLGADNDFVDAVINAFKDKTGVDITKPAISNFDAAQNYINEKGLKESDREKWTEDKTFEKLFNALTDEEKSKLKGKSYDNGGVANGLGVMVKATAQPESVNDPELTRKILSPVSNAEFNRYVRDMGIMFERSHQYAQAPIIERIGGAVDNRVNNSGQVIMNGVAIGSDKRGNSLDEILSLASIVPNV